MTRVIFTIDQRAWGLTTGQLPCPCQCASSLICYGAVGVTLYPGSPKRSSVLWPKYDCELRLLRLKLPVRDGPRVLFCSRSLQPSPLRCQLSDLDAMGSTVLHGTQFSSAVA